MKFEPEISGCAIVLIGQFNPAIFSPSWFIENGVVSAEAADDQRIEIIHPELSQVSIADMSITVELNRFTAGIQSSPWIRVGDLVSKTFGELLTHTPVAVGGINLNYHVRVGSQAVRTEWGRRLAPLKEWGKWGKRVAESEKPPGVEDGVRSMTMLENWRGEGFAGHWQVQMEPSTKIADNSGVYFAVNHQFAPTKTQSLGAAWAAEYIHDNFDAVVQEAEWILDGIYDMRPLET